jgi:hypothetical protein
MTARITHLNGEDSPHPPGTATLEMDLLFDSVPFLSTCPKCRDLRAQEGFGKRSVVRLLSRNLPIEAYCVVCDDFWEISAHERAELATRLIRQPAFTI